MYREHPSRPRNRRLAAALYRARLIEQWGTGTLRIVEACEAQGLPRPEFVSDMGTFITRFKKPSLAPERPEKMGRDERYSRALAYARENGSITRAQYQQILHVSEAQAYRDLNELAERGSLVRAGMGRASRYIPPPEA